MKSRIQLCGLAAAMAIMATTGCTVSGLPWGDVKVSADKQQLEEVQLSGPVPAAQISDPQQYQGAVKNGTDTYAKVRPCNRHYGVTCREGNIIYLFRDFVYLGYAYLWNGYWWTVPIGDGKSYDYRTHTYVNWTSIDFTQFNIEENIIMANQFIDQHVEIYGAAPGAGSATPQDQSANGSGKSPTPAAGAGNHAVTSVTLSAPSCTSVTLTADGADPTASLNVNLSTRGGSIYSGTAGSTSRSTWTKTFSGTDLRTYADSGRVQVNVTAGNYSGTESVILPSSCATTPPPAQSSAPSDSAPAYSAPTYSAPSSSAPAYSAPSRSVTTSAPKAPKSVAGTPAS